jgi:hypothetical protein
MQYGKAEQLSTKIKKIGVIKYFAHLALYFGILGSNIWLLI